MDEKLIEVLEVEPLDGLRIRLTFDDGVVKIVDVGELVRGSVFEDSFNQPDVFSAVKIYPYGEGIYWPNNFDLCPEMLRFHAKGEFLQQSSPSLLA